MKEDREATRQYLMEATYECETQPRRNMFDSDFVHCETVLEALCQSRHCCRCAVCSCVGISR